MAKFQELYEFVDRAKKNRKYPETTAQTLRASLKLYEEVLNDDEKNSIGKFKENFQQISRSVFSKNASRFNANSLMSYKSRAGKVVSDYEQYADPAKMSSWSPKVIVRAKKLPSVTRARGNAEAPASIDDTAGVSPTMHRIELALRPDVKTVLLIPKDMTETEQATIIAILKSLTTK